MSGSAQPDDARRSDAGWIPFAPNRSIVVRMDAPILPPTTERVAIHTDSRVNAELERERERRVRWYAAHRDQIPRRLRELDREWDIERALEANAATAVLLGLALGAGVSRKLFVLPGIVAGFLLQHALLGWCPPVPVFRRLGFRTQSEIERERCALDALHRGAAR
jgi:hypothetical protein